MACALDSAIGCRESHRCWRAVRLRSCWVPGSRESSLLRPKLHLARARLCRESRRPRGMSRPRLRFAGFRRMGSSWSAPASARSKAWGKKCSGRPAKSFRRDRCRGACFRRLSQTPTGGESATPRRHLSRPPSFQLTSPPRLGKLRAFVSRPTIKIRPLAPGAERITPAQMTLAAIQGATVIQ